MFASTFSKLDKLTPKLRKISLKNSGKHSNEQINQNYWPIDHFKEGMENIETLILENVAIRPIQFKGLIGSKHTYSPNLVHLNLKNALNE